MEINYQETSKDLLTRIDIHEKYGSANIDQWTTDLLKPQAGMNILDIGCGAGKARAGRRDTLETFPIAQRGTVRKHDT